MNLNTGEILRFGQLVSSEPKMIEIFKLLSNIAKTNATVLILGESGTGKELMARALHESSTRANKPFVAVNCSAIPDDLIESQLFGHVKGSYTGATSNFSGSFEQANNGTLFLDEIGDMSSKMQAKILRALETREIQPVGSNKLIKVDIRLVAATNKDLTQAVANREFRQDLLFRINAVSVEIPPLRERPGDIHLILWDMVQECNREMDRKIECITLPALGLLQQHKWPGNVRELRNVITTIMHLITPATTQIFAEHLPVKIIGEAIKENSTLPGTKYQINNFIDVLSGNSDFGSMAAETLPTLDEIESLYIKLVLKKTGFNKSKTSKILKIDRTTLYEKIKRYNIPEEK